MYKFNDNTLVVSSKNLWLLKIKQSHDIQTVLNFVPLFDGTLTFPIGNDRSSKHSLRHFGPEFYHLPFTWIKEDVTLEGHDERTPEYLSRNKNRLVVVLLSGTYVRFRLDWLWLKTRAHGTKWHSQVVLTFPRYCPLFPFKGCIWINQKCGENQLIHVNVYPYFRIRYQLLRVFYFIGKSTKERLKK